MAKDLVHRYKELRLGQLRAFCECVRYRSFSATARALGISHPSVWQQIRALERELGVTLLQRHRREMRPTEDGRVLLEMAGPIISSVDSLKEAFEQRRGAVPRNLNVVATPGAIGGELIRPVVGFCKRYPNIKVNLITNSHIERTLDLIITGDADMAILPVDVVGLAAGNRVIELEPLCDRPAALITPEHHPLAARRRIALADLTRHPLILPEPGNAWWKRAQEVFRAAGLLDRLQAVLETSLTQASLRFVSLGLGAAVLPLPRDGIFVAGIQVRSLAHLLPPEPITILRRRGTTPRPQADLFIDFVRGQISLVKDDQPDRS
jgi:DNA-binding transcriptional LysR family regulator